MNTLSVFTKRAVGLLLLSTCWLLLLSGCQALAVEVVEQSATPSTAASTSGSTTASTTASTDDVAFQRGINLGNALEAPNYEGEWGMVLEENFFAEIADAGFDHVRVPIRWSAYALDDAPYTIDEEFFARVDWVIEQSLANDLVAIVDLHHYDELMDNALEDELDGHRERFLALWRQIAERYADQPPTVFFELANEPRNPMTADVWQALWTDALTVIRESNPQRAVIVGPVDWYSIDRLRDLDLPDDRENLIVSIHYYAPFQFTHQGAEWVDGSQAWLGWTWTGTSAQQRSIQNDLDRAAAWGAEQGVPIYLGEFGAYSTAELEQRALWTDFVRSEAEARDMAWAYWEFGAGFGAYDRDASAWREPLLRALVPNSPVATQ